MERGDRGIVNYTNVERVEFSQEFGYNETSVMRKEGGTESG